MAKRSTTGKRRNRVPGKATDMEQFACHESMAASQVPALSTRVDLQVVSFRVRICDPDGVSAKAAIDGCVHRGLLCDDSAKQIREIRYKQVKVKNSSEEKTLLIFTPIDEDRNDQT